MCVLLILIVSFGSCKETTVCPAPAEAITIMPLGDSRVEGAKKDYESYRYELWKNLIDNGWKVDFVGKAEDERKYDEYQSQCFDWNHQGTGGAITLDILQTVEDMTAAEVPEVVLLGIGGNDLTDGSQSVAEVVGNINRIIDRLQTLNESITIFVEQIAPGTTAFMTEDRTSKFESFNANIPILANEQTDATSIVVAIDMPTNWSDDYMADEVHYNEAGAKAVADKYYDAIDTYLIK